MSATPQPQLDAPVASFSPDLGQAAARRSRSTNCRSGPAVLALIEARPPTIPARRCCASWAAGSRSRRRGWWSCRPGLVAGAVSWPRRGRRVADRPAGEASRALGPGRRAPQAAQVAAPRRPVRGRPAARAAVRLRRPGAGSVDPGLVRLLAAVAAAALPRRRRVRSRQRPGRHRARPSWRRSCARSAESWACRHRADAARHRQPLPRPGHDASCRTRSSPRAEPLTDDEWEFVRRHPERSAEMLGRQPAIREGAGDRRGQPRAHGRQRLSERAAPASAIPLGARILLVAEAYLA